MHIDVRDLLAQDLGFHKTYQITGEQPDFDEAVLTQPIDGEVTITRIESGLRVRGQISTALQLTCDRCLRSFVRPSRASFSQSYSEKPTADDLPIVDHQIDLAPLFQQELLVQLPIKLLDRPDCPGVEGYEQEYTKDKSGERLQDRARVIKPKGPHRGRT